VTAPRLRPTELRAWRAFLDAQAEVLRRLEADLIEGQRLTLAEYDVLVQLVQAPGRRLRMAELSERVRLSRSGVTPLVDRMAALLVGSTRRVRRSDPGLGRLRRATPTHFRGIRDYFARRLDRKPLALLSAALEPLRSSQTTRKPPSPSSK